MTPPPTWLLDHRARWHESRVAYAEFSCYGGGGPPFDLMEAKLNVPSVRPGTVPKTDVIAGLRASTDEPAQDKAPGRRAWKPSWGGHPSGGDARSPVKRREWPAQGCQVAVGRFRRGAGHGADSGVGAEGAGCEFGHRGV